jgi:hypothetical protein
MWTARSNVEDGIHPGMGDYLLGLCKRDVRSEFVHGLGHDVPGTYSDVGVEEATRVVKLAIERAEKLDGSKAKL